ncbi:SPOR domain-containing protein [Albidovulum sp.]|uniref:SPOR domain-containing protein n=1 Tax=Albidovulum sp. TaxID=1872424 RepID=UPI0039B937FB
MADADYDEFGGYGGYPEDMRDSRNSRAPGFGGVRAQKWVNGAGAVTSVALILGLGVWGYDLAVRDVRGIPVIRALEGPARVAPDNPGGELASYQGMAVNKIAADGTAGDAADQLTLAPRPEGLAADDQPMGALAASAEADLADPLAPAPVSTPAPDAAAAVPVLASLDAGEALSEEPLPDGPSEDLLGGELPAIEMSAPSADAISADVPGVAQSLRPPSRPSPRPSSRPAAAASAGADDAGYDAIAEAAAAAVAEALGAPAPAALDVASGTLAEGTRLVQIGAYPDEAQARLEWDKTAARFGALMDGKRRVIEPAVSGGATFYRLRVEGFADIEDARRFCEVFKAEGAECVPTAIR